LEDGGESLVSLVVATEHPAPSLPVELLHEDATVVDVVVGHAEQREHGRTDVGVIREDPAFDAGVTDAGADHAEEVVDDLSLHVAVVPGKAGVLGHTVRQLAWGLSAIDRRQRQGTAGRLEEVVGVAEHREARRPRRARRHHVQELHLGAIGEELGELVHLVVLPEERIVERQRPEVLLERTRDAVRVRRISGGVNRRGIVGVHQERRRVFGLGQQQRVEVGGELPTLRSPVPGSTYVQGTLTPSHPTGLGAPPTKWSPSSAVTMNSVLLLSMPRAASRSKNFANAVSYSLSCAT